MTGFGTAFSSGIWKAHSLSQQQSSLATVGEWPSLDSTPVNNDVADDVFPPSPALRRQASSTLSDHGRDLLNKALGFHEWQDIMQQRPPTLARSTSGGVASQAPSGTSKLSRGTSEFTVDSTIHLRQRMNERLITKRELQSTRKHGNQEIGEHGTLKITHKATTLIFDPKTHKGVTAYPTKEEDSTIWASVKTKMKNEENCIQSNRQQKNNASSSIQPKPKIDSFTLERFRDMGFGDEIATKAYLKANGNFREAVEELLIKMTMTQTETATATTTWPPSTSHVTPSVNSAECKKGADEVKRTKKHQNNSKKKTWSKHKNKIGNPQHKRTQH